jgi:protein phosphatase 1L
MVDGMLYLANVGDCRAVVCDAGKAIALTTDHKPVNQQVGEGCVERGGGWSAV